jgi:hypothetical protein
VSHAFFIWYRVRSEGSDTETAIRSMMARLSCRSGCPGRLMVKHHEPRLWMEIYDGVTVPELFSRQLAQAVDEYDVEMFIDGPRHTECFCDTPGLAAVCRVNP